MSRQIKLGQLAKDVVTGFTGVLTGHANYLTGCDQYSIQPLVDDKGKLEDARWFDDGRIEIIEEKVKSEDVKSDKNGCDMTAPIK